MVGELTVDDVIIEDDGVDWKQAGGGALYSAVGAIVWSDHVSLNSVIGNDYPAALLSRLVSAGIGVEAVLRSPQAMSIGLWLMYERDGTRRQFEKKRGSTFAELDMLRPSPLAAGSRPAAAHIAPQSSQGQALALEHLSGRDMIRTLDVLIEPGIDQKPYLSGEVFHDLDAFLPSEQEAVDIWGHANIQALGSWLKGRGSEATLVIKRGSEGVDVLSETSVVRVPSVVDPLVDPTGAGDAFCGGYLAGLVSTGDPVEAAICGAVSASFVCQTRGALAAAAAIDADTAQSRADQARRALRKVS